MTVAEKIIERFGGVSKLAAILGHDYPTRVQGWKKRGVIPAKAQADVLRAARNNAVDLEPADFFPEDAQ